MSQDAAHVIGEPQLRSRSAPQPPAMAHDETAKDKVMRMNQEQQSASNGKPRKTFGRTPGGQSKSLYETLRPIEYDR